MSAPDLSRVPAISVLVPAFNAAGTLRLSLRSLQCQTEQSWECVVVDDGSVDGTAQIAATVAREDARVRVSYTPHGGIVQALSVGIEACRAPLIARMDADDLMSRRRLERQRSALDMAPGLSAVGSHVRLFPRANLRDGLKQYEHWLESIRTPEDVRREAFVECPIVHPTLMIRRPILTSFGYRERGWPEDYDLILRLLAAKHRIGVVPERLLHWRDGATRLSRTSPNYALPTFALCKAEFLAQGFLAEHERYLLWGFGDTGKSLAAALAELGKHPAAILELHPRRLGQLIRGVRVVHPSTLPALPRLPLVVSVAGATARAQIRESLSRMGFSELTDYVCAA